MGVFYVYREDVISALDIKVTAWMNSAIDSAIESSSRNVESLCHRHFYPLTGTRIFDFPNDQTATTGRIWLNDHEVISLNSFTAGGVTIPPANYFLEPINNGPPYTRIDIDRSTSSVLTSAASGTSQHAITLQGVFGYDNQEVSAGTLTTNPSSSTLTLGLSASVGTGAVLRIDSERMLVTDRSWVNSTQVGTLANSNSAVSLSVSDGTQFAVNEQLLIESERLQVVDIAGNTLTVRRGWGGTVLAQHTAAPIYWPRQVTVQRGALGTAAASHSSAAPVLRQVPPGLVTELSLAYTLDTLEKRGSAYARTVGQGEGTVQVSGRSIRDLEDDCFSAHGRKSRIRAVA